ncbi:MAG TPA: tetratricopeptide repeat protein [Thermoanaerobaculia bacterium]|nr:tetratricopeptide repeat protein [Thermoanaerobaculia bacterium]
MDTASSRSGLVRTLGLIAAALILPAALTAQDASRLEADAKRAFDAGRFVEAGEKYAKAAEVTATADRKGELYFQSGWAFFIGGKSPAARDSLRAAYTARPTLGIEPELYSPDFVRLARSVQTEVTGAGLPSVDANELMRTAREKIADGKASEALYDLKKIEASSDPRVHRLMADAYDRLGRAGDADAERRKAADLERGLVTSAPIGTPLPGPSPGPVATSPPSGASQILEAADRALAAGDYRGAQAMAHRALDVDPRSAEAHRLAGDGSLGLGQDSDAEREYTAAIVLDAGNAGAEYGLGRVAERQKKWNTAASHYRRALELNSRNVGAALGLGRSMEEVDKTAARIAYGRAIEIDPASPEARNDFGVFLFRSGETDRATTELIEAVRLASQKAVYHENLGRVLRKQGKTKEAEREMSEATGLAPNDTDAWITLGHLRMELKKFDEAATAFRAAADLDPANEEPASGLSAALLEAGRASDAEAALTKALATNGKSAVLWNNLGVVRSRKGAYPGAIEAFQKALAIDAGFEAARANLTRAEQLAAIDRAAA